MWMAPNSISSYRNLQKKGKFCDCVKDIGTVLVFNLAYLFY